MVNYYKTQGRSCRNLSSNLRKPVRVDETKWEVKINNSGADKSLAQPGRKQATATEDFDVHISYL